MEMSDYDLVKGCLQGNTQLFEELVKRYKRLIYSVVNNIINDKDEVNDIAQEVFLRIFKALNRYDPQYKFSTWSVKIATNLCLDIIRKKKPEYVSVEELNNYSNDTDTPETNYINKERSQRIKEAVSGLPEKYKIPIVLYHQHGMSYQEMTQILKEPMSIVKNRLYRARLILKDKLGKERREEIL